MKQSEARFIIKTKNMKKTITLLALLLCLKIWAQVPTPTLYFTITSHNEPQEVYTEVGRADLLRACIVSETHRHGKWLQLVQYKPLPKRIAMSIAQSWRHSNPTRFGGKRNFRARIVPVGIDGGARTTASVSTETLYGVAVFYPKRER